jgi:hypothetical protein
MLYIKISNSWKNGLLILFTQVLLGRKVLYQIIAEDISSMITIIDAFAMSANDSGPVIGKWR